MKKLKVGAVIYAPRVTIIWDMIADYIKENSNYLEIEPTFFDTYRNQVKSLLKGEIDIAWNSPLANLEAELKSNNTVKHGCMRDTDRDLYTVLVTRKNSEINSVDELKGKKIAFGAIDSPQARLIPINYLKENSLIYGRDYEEVRFDVGIGLDGDHGGGELDALKSVQNGECDAAFSFEKNFNHWLKDGSIDQNKVKVIDKTNSFDHCIFTASPNLDEKLIDEFDKTLMTMDYNNEDHKEILDLEGLKEWVPGRTTNFDEIRKAVNYLDFFDL